MHGGNEVQVQNRPWAEAKAERVLCNYRQPRVSPLDWDIELRQVCQDKVNELFKLVLAKEFDHGLHAQTQ